MSVVFDHLINLYSILKQQTRLYWEDNKLIYMMTLFLKDLKLFENGNKKIFGELNKNRHELETLIKNNNNEEINRIENLKKEINRLENMMSYYIDYSQSEFLVCFVC